MEKLKKLISYVLIFLIEVTLVINNYQTSVNAIESIMTNYRPGLQYYYVNPFDQEQNTEYVQANDSVKQENTNEEAKVVETYVKRNADNLNDSAEKTSFPALDNINVNESQSSDDEEFKISAPLGLRTIETDNYIVLVWDKVLNAERYELEFDGQIIDCGSKNLFVQTNLKDLNVHKYRVRAINSKYTSEWSSYVEASKDDGVFDAPANVAALPTGDCIVVCWNSVVNAQKYEIEVDGEVIDNDISTNYIHRNLQPKTTHTYRVRAKEGNLYSKWSKAITATSVNTSAVTKPANKEETSDSKLQGEMKKEPVNTEVKTEEKTPAKEEAKTEEKAPAKEEVKPEEKTPAKEEAKTEEKTLAKEEAKPEEKAPAKEEAKAEEKAPVKEEVKPEEKVPAMEEVLDESKIVTMAYEELDRVTKESQSRVLTLALASVNTNDLYEVKTLSSLNTTSQTINIDGVYEIGANESLTISSNQTLNINASKKYVGFKVYGTLKIEGNASNRFKITTGQNFSIVTCESGNVIMDYCDVNVNSRNESASDFITNKGNLTVSNSNFQVTYSNCVNSPGTVCNETSKLRCLYSDTSKEVSICGSNFKSWHEAMVLRGTGNYLIKSCNITNNKVGIAIDGQDNDYISGNNQIKITKNQHIDSNGIGILITRRSEEPIHKKLSITSNSFDNNKESSIFMKTDKLHNISIKQNIFKRNSIDAITDANYKKTTYTYSDANDFYGGPICIDISAINESNDKFLNDSLKNLNSGSNKIYDNNNLQGLVLYGSCNRNIVLNSGDYKYVLLNVTVEKGAQLTLTSGVEAAIYKTLIVKGSLMCLGKDPEVQSYGYVKLTSVDDIFNKSMYTKANVLKAEGFRIYCDTEGVVDAIYTLFLRGGSKENGSLHAFIENKNVVTLRRGCSVTSKIEYLDKDNQKFSDSVYDGILNYETGKLTLIESDVMGFAVGIKNYGKATILKSNIMGNNVGVKIYKTQNPVLISKCSIMFNKLHGVNSDGWMQLYNSAVLYSQVGVYVTSYETHETDYSKIFGNSIKGNEVGVYVKNFTRLGLQYNNIFGNSKYGVQYVERAANVWLDISNNYWGNPNGPSYEAWITDMYGNRVKENFNFGDYIGLYDSTLKMDTKAPSEITHDIPLDEDKVTEESFSQMQKYIADLEQKNFEDSINPANGNYSREVTDLLVESPGITIKFSRMYNSNASYGEGYDVLGIKWRFYYIAYIKDLSSSVEGKVVYLPGGQASSFQKNPNGSFSALDSRNTLTVDGNGNYILKTKDDIYYKYDKTGFLYEIEDKKGNKLYFKKGKKYVSEIWDGTGRKYLINYDSNDCISTIQEYIDGSLKRTLRYNYNNYPSKNISTLDCVVDLNGNIKERYSYDEEGKIVKVIYGSNVQEVQEKITYYSDGDNKGKIKQVINKDGLISDYSYNNSKNCVTIKDNTGYQYDTIYDSKYSTTYTIDCNGNYTINKSEINTYLYDLNNRVIGKIEELTYQRDKYGFSKSYILDDKGNIVKEYFSGDVSKIYSYDKNNNVIREIDSNGNKTLYVYDSTGKYLLSIAKPLHNGYDYTTMFTNPNCFFYTRFSYYDKEKDSKNYCVPFNGLVKTITKTDGTFIKYEYDKFGNKIYEIIKVADNKFAVVKYQYNEFGKLISKSNPYEVSKIDDFEYRKVPADTKYMKYTYDNNGNMLSETNQEGAVTKYTYDKFNRNTSVTNPISKNASGSTVASITYTYNMAGKVVSQKDLLGNVKEYSYDYNGNLVKEKNSVGGIFLYTYDNNNRIIKKEFKADENSEAIVLEENAYILVQGVYDDKKHCQLNYIKNFKKVYTSKDQYYKYVDIYDFRNQLVEHINLKTDGKDHGYEYDDTMIISKVTNKYDGNGNLISKTNENGYTTYFVYDFYNNLIKSYEPVKNGTSSDGKSTVCKYKVTEFTYDMSGNKLKEIIGSELVDLYEDIKKTSILVDYYSPNDNIDVDFGFVDNYYEKTYTYDKLGQVLSETDNAGKKILYEYDIRGNLVVKKEYYSDDKYITTSHKYDNTNRRLTDSILVMKSDLTGYAETDNDTILLTTSYKYDLNGNLLEVTYRDGSTLTNKYDGLNRVIESVKTIVADGKVLLTAKETNTYLGNTEKVALHINSLGNKTEYKYDSMLRLIEKDFYNQNVKEKCIEKFGYNYLGDEIGKLVIYNDTEKRFVKTYDLNGKVLIEQIVVKNADNTNKYYPVKAYQYDLAGNLIKEVNGEQYNAANGSTLESKINNAVGTERKYDFDNRLISVLTPEDKKAKKSYTTAYEYDGYDNVIKETDSYGNSFKSYYDPAGRILGKVFVGTTNDGIIEKYTYDKMGNLLTSMDSNGNITNYEVNTFGALKSKTLPGDNTIGEEKYTYKYDVSGNLAETIDSLGRVEKTLWNTLGKAVCKSLESKDGALKIQESYEYDAAGNVIKYVDANGNSVTYKYDIYGNVIEKSINGKVVYNYNYDFFNNLLCVTDKFGNKIINVYDECGRLVEKKYNYKEIKDGKESDVFVIIEQNEYDLNGNLISKKDALGNKVTYTYDLNNRVVAVTDETGITTRKEYDSNDRVTKEIDAYGNATAYEYSGSGRLLSVIKSVDEKNTLVSSYEYDNNGNKLVSILGDNKTYYKYNCRNEVISVIDTELGLGQAPRSDDGPIKAQTYTYNVDGSIKNIKDKNGNVISYEYDIFGRKIKESSKAGVINYEYDNAGNIIKVYNSGNQQETTTFKYDDENRVTEKEVSLAIGQTVKITYTYDVKVEGTGKHKTLVNIGENNTVTETYDEMGRLIKVNDVSYTYYDNASKKETIYADGSKECYFYNKDLTLSKLSHINSKGVVTSTYSYKYDKNKNLIETVDAKGTTSYTYDKSNRLIKVVTPDKKITEYTYDKSGNRIREIVTIGNDTFDKVYEYKDGRLVRTIDNLTGTNLETSFVYDYNGNTLEEITKTTETNSTVIKDRKFVYDAYNRVISISEGDNVLETNSYNYEGLRVVKDVNGKKTINIYDEDSVVLELDELGNIKAKNLFGTKLISREIDGVKGYYRYNGHGDVVEIRDAADSILASYYYDAFGKVEDSQGSFDNPYRYSGYIYDEEAEYYYLQSRMYDPVNGRFIQQDSYRGDDKDPLSLNLYTYCANNPLIYDDQNGHFFGFIKKAASAIGNGIKRVASKVVSFAKTAYTYVKKAATAVVNFVKSIPAKIKSVYNTVKSYVSKGVKAVKNAYSYAVNKAVQAAQALAAKQRAIQERIRQEKERAVKWIQTKKEEVVNAVKKIDVAQVVSGMSDMAAGIGAISIGVGALLVPGVGLVAGAIALGTVVCGAGLTITGFGDVHQGFTGVDPVRNLAKGLGMSDEGYDTMKFGFMAGSLGGSIYSGNVVRLFGKAGAKMGMAAGGEAAGTAGKAAVAAEEETAVVQRASSSASEKTFTLPGDRNPQCFVAGTLIVTEFGDKPIEDIKVGDKVYSENEYTGERGFKRVTRLFVNLAKTLVHLIINGTKIDTTEKHPFWVIGKGWVKAADLKAGNKVSLKTGEIGNVDSVEVESLEKPVKVYNFEVEDWHTYFVSDIGVLVHNKCWVDVSELADGANKAADSVKTSNKPTQIHHFATNKSTKYTKRFEDITNKYGLELDERWNKEPMPHQGRHPYAYHEYMLDQMNKIDRIANGDRTKFLDMYERVKGKIKDNPEMLYKDYWKNK